MTPLCPMCGIESAPPLIYGETDRRRYVCNGCWDRGELRAAAMGPEIARRRRRREARTARWRAEQAAKDAERQREQDDRIEAIRRQWPNRL